MEYVITLGPSIDKEPYCEGGGGCGIWNTGKALFILFVAKLSVNGIDKTLLTMLNAKNINRRSVERS